MIKKRNQSPTNNIINIESRTTKTNIEIRNTEGYFLDKYYFEDIVDDQLFHKFIKEVENRVRTSDEYKMWVGDLHEKGLNRCAVLGNVMASDNVTIEMHHYPFTLYEIVYLNARYHIDHNIKMTTFSIVDSILTEHAEQMISVVPLCKLVHILAHDGLVFIPLTSVYLGRQDEFIEKYEPYMTDYMIDNYNTIYEATENGTSYSIDNILAQIKDKDKKKLGIE